MSKIKEIVDGHINELKSKVGLVDTNKEEIFKVRAKICNSCPLKTSNTCSTRKWINPNTMDVSNVSKSGYVKGCGCRLSAKQKSPSSKMSCWFLGRGI